MEAACRLRLSLGDFDVDFSLSLAAHSRRDHVGDSCRRPSAPKWASGPFPACQSQVIPAGRAFLAWRDRGFGMESTKAKTGGRSLKLVADARSASGIVLIAIMALTFAMRKPLPLLVYLALALASA